jgi:hypothetical protein
MHVETAWKRSARRLLDAFDIQATRATPSSEVLGLFNKLRPVMGGPKLIRLGGPSDGGYLIPDDLDGIDCCYSAGVGNTSLFEADLSQRGIRSLMADYSVDGPPIDDPKFTFLKRYVGTCDSETEIEINRWVNSGRAQTPMLQMDIEGGEYNCLLALSPEHLRAFRIIVLEVHQIGAWRNPPFLRIANGVVAKLLADFVVVHLHANNTAPTFGTAQRRIPAVIELTLLRRDRVENGPLPWACLPHPLDRPNDPDQAEVPLGHCWTTNR